MAGGSRCGSIPVMFRQLRDRDEWILRVAALVGWLASGWPIRVPVPELWLILFALFGAASFGAAFLRAANEQVGMRLKLWLALILTVLSPAPAALAQVPEQRHIATRFIAESDAPAAGSTVSPAVQMTPEGSGNGGRPAVRSLSDQGQATASPATGGPFSEGRLPLYILYSPGKPPEILPQLLTVSRVVSLTKKEH